MRFATVGDNTIDEYVGVLEESYVGGNAVNVAVRLAELGEDVAYFGAVGPDARGERVGRELAARGVAVAHLVVVPGHTSTSQVTVAESGERSLSSEDFGTCADYVPGEAELDELGHRGIVHIGWTPSAREVRRALRARGVVVAQDCAVTAGYADLDIAFCSAGEDPVGAPALAREAIAGGARLAVVTRGAAGSLAFDGTRWWSQRAEPIDAVDTTGAGDSYIAGFLSALGQAGSVAECMAKGAAAAAQTCQHRGGFRQSPLVGYGGE